MLTYTHIPAKKRRQRKRRRERRKRSTRKMKRRRWRVLTCSLLQLKFQRFTGLPGGIGMSLNQPSSLEDLEF